MPWTVPKEVDIWTEFNGMRKAGVKLNAQYLRYLECRLLHRSSSGD